MDGRFYCWWATPQGIERGSGMEWSSVTIETARTGHPLIMLAPWSTRFAGKN